MVTSGHFFKFNKVLFNLYLLEASKAKAYYRSLTNSKIRDINDNLTNQAAAEWKKNFESITFWYS